MTLPLRRLVFWLHLVVGVVVAAIVVVMSVTGVLLTYEKQMIRWADGYHTPPRPGDTRIPLEQLVASAAATRPDQQPQGVTVRRADDAPVEVGFGRAGTVFLHPYTGEVLGTGSARARAFFRGVTDWHRWLGRQDGQRAVGRAVTGAANLGFFFIVVSGFYLWWPRTWTGAQFRQVVTFRRGLAPKARDFNWHNVIGFWSLVPLAVIVWSGVVISYPWASDLTYRLVGEAPPARPTPGAAPAPGGQRGPGGPAAEAAQQPARAATAPQPPAIDPLVAAAAGYRDDWRIISVRLPVEPTAPAAVTVDSGSGAQPHKRGTLTLDAASGAVLGWEGFEASSPGRQWRTWLRFAHTGEWYGLAGQTVAGIVTLGTLVLVWTGIALSLRRLRAWMARRRAPRSARPQRTAA